MGELHLARRRGDGALKLAATAHGADAELVTEVLDALSGPAGPDDQRPLGQRRMDALVELCEQAISPTGVAGDDDHDLQHPPAKGDHHDSEDGSDGSENDPHQETVSDDGAGGSWPWDEAPDDETPDDEADEYRDNHPHHEPAGNGASGKNPTSTTKKSTTSKCAPMKIAGRALLSITMDQEWLTAQVGHGTLDSGFTISPAEARKLACDCGIVPMVLDAKGVPLDVGRLRYTAPDGLRRALYNRDRGCSFPGCTRRPKRCHVHHVRHWLDGGDTALSNTTLLCRYHHHVVHHDHWVIEMRDNRPWYVPPRWIDPEQRPRPGGRFSVTG